jgi:hypothetical protein
MCKTANYKFYAVLFDIEIRECMLSLCAEFVVFQFAIQKLKD